ncbi:MAG: hypothetical protein AAB373_01720 [Patescibacteria group bacterium]
MGAERSNGESLPWVINGAAGAIGTTFMKENGYLNETEGYDPEGVNIGLLNDLDITDTNGKILHRAIDRIKEALTREGPIDDNDLDVERGGNDYLIIDGKKIKVSSIKDPDELAEFAKKELGTHGMLNSTGRYLTGSGSRRFTQNGSEYVLVPSPTDPKHEDDPIGPVLIPGLTDFALGRRYNGETSVSNDSCIAKNKSIALYILAQTIGFSEASIGINHSATRDDLNTLLSRYADGHFKHTDTDWMQVRPSTHVDQGIGRILGPELSAKVTTHMTRYPTSYGVLSDINIIFDRETTPDELREIFSTAAGNLVGPNEMVKVKPSLKSSREIAGDPTNCIVIADSIRGRSLITLRTAFDNLVAPSRNAVRAARVISDWDAANRR